MMTGSISKPYLLVLLLTTAAFGFIVRERDGKREVPGADEDFEGVVEEYIMALDLVDEELRTFYKTAPPGLKPDPHTYAQENLKRLRLKLKESGLSEETLSDILSVEKNTTNEIREQNTGRRKRTISSYDEHRWTKGIVPYLYTNEITIYGEQQIERAMHVYERFTCIRYKPWFENNGVTTNQVLGLGHPGHLKFVDNDSGCWSYVGNLRQYSGQTISCCTRTTCVHELGHALGLYHEHQSANPDRDWVIRINEQNIQSDRLSQYDPIKNPSRVMDFGYDLSSYMHYSTWGFAIGSAPTYDVLVDGLIGRTGHYYLMMTVSLAHKCEELFCSDLTSTLTCHNDGYLTLVDGKCACRCLPGLDPDTGCTTIYKSDPASLMFPPGKYALTAPAAGCPKGSFLEGSRTHYNDGGNSKSSTYSLKGDITDKTVEEHFCVSDSTPSDTRWPNGNYCIYRKGGVCPDGFKEAFVQFDDNPATLSNQVSGELPDGVFDKNTRFEFCCQNHGFSQDEIFLPSRKPLVLIKHPYEDCQKIRGMHVTVEYTRIDNSEDEGIAATGGVDPVYRTDSSTNAYYIRYCYYIPAVIDCGDVIELDANNPTATFSSPATANELECYWLIKAPPGERIQLDFNSFNVKSSSGTCIDEVEIRYSRPGQLGQNYCGNGVENTITSYNNTVHIRLSTFGNSVSSFSATVKLLDNSCYDEADRGTSYGGKVSFTSDLVPCIPWRDATECIYNPYNIEVNNTLLTENYCRNPDFKTGIQPWCYINTNCDRKYCDVCLTGKRSDRRDDCSTLKRFDFCSGSSALDVCAETCTADLFPTSMTCGQPNPVIGSSIVETLKSSYSVGEKVTYKCETRDNIKERVCLSSGEWSVLGFVCGECPDGWHLFEEKCYRFYPSSQTFTAAKAQCSEFDAIVAPAKSQEENDFLSALAQGNSIWLGMTDEDVEGTWVFLDGGEVQWTNWKSDQPDNWQMAEHCANMLPNGQWNDLFCFTYEYPYVCMTPKRALSKCLDFWDQCDELLAHNPDMCTTKADFAEQQCSSTCGFCSTENAVECNVDTPEENSQTSEARSTVSEGEVVTYTCNSGYVRQSGDASRTCLDSGSLSGSPLTCVKETVECNVDSPQENSQTSEARSTVSEGEVVTYTCNSGYVRQSGDASRTCLDSGSLSGSPLTCVKETVECNVDTPQENSQTSEARSTVSEGEVVTYTCNSGYVRQSGDASRTCLDSGSLSGSPLTCVKETVECNVDTPQENSQTSEARSTVSEGEVVTYTCNSGYVRQSGDATRTCLDSGSLSGSPLTCVKETVECNVDSPQENSQTSEARSTVSEGEVVTYTCNSGYVRQSGDASRTCLDSGSLSGSPLTCVKETVECNVDTPQENSQTSEARSTVSEGEVVTYTCNSGYVRQSGDATRTCLDSGSLSGSPLTCVKETVECNVDTPHENSQTSEARSTVSEGEVVTYTCNSGYVRQSGDASRTCLDSGSLSGSPLTCVKETVECNVDTPHENSQTSEARSTVSEGEVVTYTCNSGYVRQSGDATRTCLDSGSLSGSPLTCVKETVECNVDSPQENSQTSEARSTVSEGEVVTYTCNSGYVRQSGDASRTCLDSGSLSGSPLTCVKETVECNVDMPQENSQTSEARSTVSEGEVVTYTCNSGYVRQSGDASRTCLDSGSLSGSPLTCVKETVECNVDTPEENSQTSEARSTVSEGEVVTYTCNSGYVRQSGDASRTCLDSGSLSGSPLTCVKETVECNVDSPQENSQTSEARSTVSEGEVVTYTCNSGYVRQSGDASRTCLDSGSLSGSPLTCVKETVECNVDSPQENSQTSEARSTVSEGEVVTYTCNSGYVRQSGDASRTCLDSGSLGGSPLTCVKETVECNVDVDTPQENSQTSEARSTVSEGEVVTYTCNSGYVKQSGDASRTCLDSGSLSGSPLTCVKETVECNVDSPQENSQTSEARSTVSEGEVVTYTCNSGYIRQSGDASRTCMDSGSLSGSPLTCVKETVECNVDSPQENSQTSEARSTVSEGEVVTYTCNSGYVRQSGDASRTCLDSGSLGGSPLTCVKETVECNVDTPQENSQTSEARSTVSEGEVVTYTCNSGYVKQSGDASRTCLDSGSLSGSPLTCVKETVECNVDTPEENSQTSEARSTVSEGEVVTYTCNSGYVRQSGDATRTCLNSGSLSGSPLTCVKETVECNVDSPQENSQTSEARSTVSEGEVVTYTCNSGYVRQSGDASRTCLDSGSLGGSPLTCKEENTECPEGWTINPENNHCYKYFDQRKKYIDAEKICSDNKGVLAMPKTASQLDFIHSLRSTNRVMWIGLDDRENEGTWIWADRTLVAGWTNWLRGQPDDAKNGQDCGRMQRNKKWVDVECNRRLRFVCEVSMSGCPAEWTLNSVNNQCYRFFDESMAFSSAQARCASFQSIVATAKTQNELDFISDLRDGNTIWLGLNDITTEGTWYWADGQALNGWTNWSPGHPTARTPGHDCVSVTPGKLWRNVLCFYNYRVVCQMAA